MWSIKISRAKFILFFTVIIVGLVWTYFERFKWFFTPKAKKFTGSTKGANVKAGHQLHQDFIVPSDAEVLEVDVLIIGAGISGLSAAYHLTQNSDRKITLLDLDNGFGGNSSSGSNAHTKYPWGAHYLPLPSIDNPDLINFLRKAEAITGFDTSGLPIFNEEYLCHEPEERLLINGKWQKGLIPFFGLNDKEIAQNEAFLSLMEEFKVARGNDGLKAFDIPLINSSKDPKFTDLDKISFYDYCLQKGFDSPYLQWYLDYCCRDDYGLDSKNTSAWAGIHYSASRYGKASGAESTTLLTWPEGNSWLAQKLFDFSKKDFLPNHLVRKVTLENDKVVIYCTNLKTDKIKKIVAKDCIVSSPQFVNKKIIDIPSYLERDQSSLSYSSWLVANIQLSNFPKEYGEDLCWDNVIYGSKSLGYVWNEHQKIVVHSKLDKNITFYMALSDDANPKDRIKALTSSYEQQTKIVLEELKKAHHNIAEYIVNIDTWIWGHGMVAPKVNTIWSEKRKEFAKDIDEKIHFAHSDISGISIFEEAFYQGVNAAKKII